MYSRSADRIPTALPEHYGGNAFRPDGTPTPIPVRREIPPTFRPAPPLKIPEKAIGETGEDRDTVVPPVGDPLPRRADEEHAEPRDEPRVDAHAAVLPAQEVAEEAVAAVKAKDAGFLSRMTSGVLPGLREDDLLLLLLLYLLSFEEGNGEILLLLAAVLLLG